MAGKSMAGNTASPEEPPAGAQNDPKMHPNIICYWYKTVPNLSQNLGQGSGTSSLGGPRGAKSTKNRPPRLAPETPPNTAKRLKKRTRKPPGGRRGPTKILTKSAKNVPKIHPKVTPKVTQTFQFFGQNFCVKVGSGLGPGQVQARSGCCRLLYSLLQAATSSHLL